jgi:RimJ/RimL family protein N-acetyltransferase
VEDGERVSAGFEPNWLSVTGGRTSMGRAAAGRDRLCPVERLNARSFRAEDLAIVEPWFEDSETQRWLGGKEWPRRLLELAHPPDRRAWLFTCAGRAMGLLDIERFAGRSAAVAVVVAPEHRGAGMGTSILGSVLDLPGSEDVEQVIGEVEVGNAVGERCVRAAGFGRRSDIAAEERFVRFVLRRGA